MIRLLRQAVRDFPTWERPVQLSFALSALLLVLSIVLLLFSPPEARAPLFIGLFLLVLVVQGVVLFAYRNMAAGMTRAQRAYLNRDFERARALLERDRARGRLHWRGEVLLGNTYRMLGDLEASKTILYETIDNHAAQHFPYYAIGRTLLAEGSFALAASAFERAIALGAPAGVQVDYAEALYRAGEAERAAKTVAQLPPEALEDPHYTWMVTLLARRLHIEHPDAVASAEGEAYWRDMAARFAHTPYGIMLTDDITRLNAE
jgi:tetratricopeptide (TPR) repeat protein